MVMHACTILLFVSCIIGVQSYGSSTPKKSTIVPIISLGNAKAACATSRELKRVYNYVTAAVREYESKYDEIVMIRDIARLKVLKGVSDYFECGRESSFLLYTHERLETMKAMLEKLMDVGIKAAGSAAIAAGRLDEFISIFKQAHGNPKSAAGKCPQMSGAGATSLKSLLGKCYDTSSDDDNEFYGIQDEKENEGTASTGRNDKDLGEFIFTTLSGGGDQQGNGAGGNSDWTCPLATVSSNSRYVKDKDIQKDVKWADGVFAVKKGHEGGVWAKNPTMVVPTLRNAANDFSEFRKVLRDLRGIYAGIIADWLKNKMKYDEDIKKTLAMLGQSEITPEETLFHSHMGIEDEKGPKWLSDWNEERMTSAVLKEELRLCEQKELSTYSIGLRGKLVTLAAAAGVLL
ncbi:Transferrin receptor-like, PAG-like [Trypanosoma congolense IL3000]|uniref:Transferrin receptor-like, PAG-like n=1 Tax=Trypanosoma congolense (strain IL3000) TaxID=1068625 RepID=F9W5S7_TRYCI|nr:Transferrin receptor-like, PAG-like [Trypanosoma congolense IL3000]